MGYTEAADNYTHFSYEMVALTPRCAIELGYTLSDEDRGKSYIEVSGRKGFGVKADDLLDQLIAAAKSFFFFNDPATTEIYTLSLHDALPIWDGGRPGAGSARRRAPWSPGSSAPSPPWSACTPRGGRAVGRRRRTCSR